MKKLFRLDNLMQALTGGNFFSGLKAPGMDRTIQNTPQSFVTTLYEDRYLIDLYMTNGLAARVVDLPADDAGGGEFTISDDDGTLAAEFERLHWHQKCADTLRWARVYGCAMMIVIADDSPRLDLPLDLNNLGQITDLRVVSGSRTMLSVSEYYDDPASHKYGWPMIYMVQPSGQRGKSYLVHETRTLKVSGLPVPGDVARLQNIPWKGRSALQGPGKNIERYTNGLEWSERMLERKQQAIVKYAGLGELISETMDPVTGISTGQEAIKQRVNLADMSRSLLNMIALDAEDEFEVKDLNLSGVPEVLNMYQISISADSGIAVTTLFGRSPAGHNATGQSDQENYYKLCGRIQQNDVKPLILGIIPMIVSQRSFSGTVQATFNIVFTPMWLPTEFDQAKANNENATADFNRAQALSQLVINQILSADEAAAFLAETNQYGLTKEAMIDRKTPTPSEDPNDVDG